MPFCVIGNIDSVELMLPSMLTASIRLLVSASIGIVAGRKLAVS